MFHLKETTLMVQLMCPKDFVPTSTPKTNRRICNMENRLIELKLEQLVNDVGEIKRGVSVIALMLFWFFSATPILLALILWRVW